MLQQTIMLCQGTPPMTPGTYVRAYATVEYSAALAPITPSAQLVNKSECAIEERPECAVQAIMIRSPLRQENVNIAASRDIRCAIYNPKWGTVRTVARGPHHMLGTLIKALCPDFIDSAEPHLVIHGSHIPNNTLLGQLPRDRAWQIAFGGPKPWPTQMIEI